MRFYPHVPGTLTLAALCLAAPAFAIDWNDERSARAFGKLDINRDGGVTVEEYRSGVQQGERDEGEAHFRKIDADGNGRITPRELRSQWTTANNALREELWEHDDDAQDRVEDTVFTALDADGDQSLSLGEFEAGAKEGEAGRAGREFGRIDDSNDDALSREEFGEDWERFRKVLRPDLLYPARAGLALSRSEMQERAFAALDLNGNGSLDRGEYRAGVRAGAEPDRGFRLIDDNGDGELSRAELYEDWGSVADALRPDLYEADGVVGVERRVVERRTVERRVVRDASPESLDERFNEMDANDNGWISIREFRAEADEDDSRQQVDARFNRLDRDGDGSIDRTEFDAGWRTVELREDVELEVEIDD